MKRLSLSGMRIIITFLKTDIMYNMNTPIWQLTVGEFIELQQRFSNTNPPTNVATNREKRLVYGLKGIAELFNCSIVTAQKIKNEGIIDKAITQLGKKIIVDADLALKLANESKVKSR